MSIFDKVKETAQQVAADAKKAGAQLQSKVEQGQLRKKADEAAKRLGYLVVRERTGGEAAGEEADGLVAEIVGLEEQIAAEAEKAAAEAEKAEGEAEKAEGEAEKGEAGD